jgi:16S rRNA processing protein RimM
MKEFLEFIIKHLIDKPNEMQINEIDGERTVVYELRVGQGDMGKVIGKHGKTAKPSHAAGGGLRQGRQARGVRDSRVSANPPQMVMIGEIVRAHGLAGMVKVRATTDDPGRFALLKQVHLQHGEKRLGEFVIEAIQIAPAAVLVKFRGVNDRDSAEQLRGAGLMITREECLPTGPDQFYQFDIIGLPVYTAAGEAVGEIVDIETTRPTMWVIRRESRKIDPGDQARHSKWI